MQHSTQPRYRHKEFGNNHSSQSASERQLGGLSKAIYDRVRHVGARTMAENPEEARYLFPNIENLRRSMVEP